MLGRTNDDSARNSGGEGAVRERLTENVKVRLGIAK